MDERDSMGGLSPEHRPSGVPFRPMAAGSGQPGLHVSIHVPADAPPSSSGSGSGSGESDLASVSSSGGESVSTTGGSTASSASASESLLLLPTPGQGQGQGLGLELPLATPPSGSPSYEALDIHSSSSPPAPAFPDSSMHMYAPSDTTSTASSPRSAAAASLPSVPSSAASSPRTAQLQAAPLPPPPRLHVQTASPLLQAASAQSNVADLPPLSITSPDEASAAVSQQQQDATLSALSRALVPSTSEGPATYSHRDERSLAPSHMQASSSSSQSTRARASTSTVGRFVVYEQEGSPASRTPGSAHYGSPSSSPAQLSPVPLAGSLSPPTGSLRTPTASPPDLPLHSFPSSIHHHMAAEPLSLASIHEANLANSLLLGSIKEEGTPAPSDASGSPPSTAERRADAHAVHVMSSKRLQQHEVQGNGGVDSRGIHAPMGATSGQNHAPVAAAAADSDSESSSSDESSDEDESDTDDAPLPAAVSSKTSTPRLNVMPPSPSRQNGTGGSVAGVRTHSGRFSVVDFQDDSSTPSLHLPSSALGGAGGVVGGVGGVALPSALSTSSASSLSALTSPQAAPSPSYAGGSAHPHGHMLHLNVHSTRSSRRPQQQVLDSLSTLAAEFTELHGENDSLREETRTLVAHVWLLRSKLEAAILGQLAVDVAQETLRVTDISNLACVRSPTHSSTAGSLGSGEGRIPTHPHPSYSHSHQQHPHQQHHLQPHHPQQHQRHPSSLSTSPAPTPQAAGHHQQHPHANSTSFCNTPAYHQQQQQQHHSSSGYSQSMPASATPHAMYYSASSGSNAQTSSASGARSLHPSSLQQAHPHPHGGAAPNSIRGGGGGGGTNSNITPSPALVKEFFAQQAAQEQQAAMAQQQQQQQHHHRSHSASSLSGNGLPSPHHSVSSSPPHSRQRARDTHPRPIQTHVSLSPSPHGSGGGPGSMPRPTPSPRLPSSRKGSFTGPGHGTPHHSHSAHNLAVGASSTGAGGGSGGSAGGSRKGSIIVGDDGSHSLKSPPSSTPSPGSSSGQHAYPSHPHHAKPSHAPSGSPHGSPPSHHRGGDRGGGGPSLHSPPPQGAGGKHLQRRPSNEQRAQQGASASANATAAHVQQQHGGTQANTAGKGAATGQARGGGGGQSAAGTLQHSPAHGHSSTPTTAQGGGPGVLKQHQLQSSAPSGTAPRLQGAGAKSKPPAPAVPDLLDQLANKCIENIRS